MGYQLSFLLALGCIIAWLIAKIWARYGESTLGDGP